MSLEASLEMARSGRLYPSLILHGGTEEARRDAALRLARTLLCAGDDRTARPCGNCRHCSRIAGGGEAFHPDAPILERDTRTATSVSAVREFIGAAQLSPFEARGQVFTIAAAETLSGEGANALLKSLEEPHATAPRHFLLLAPSQFDLLPTLRSRSLAVFLGAAPRPVGDELEALSEEFGRALERFAETGAGVYLLAAASVLERGSDFRDPRAAAGWTLSAAAVVRAAERFGAAWRRPLLELGEALLGASDLRLRGIPAARILDGLVSRHLGAIPIRSSGG